MRRRPRERSPSRPIPLELEQACATRRRSTWTSGSIWRGPARCTPLATTGSGRSARWNFARESWNLLLFAVDERSPHHRKSRDWLTAARNGNRRVALPWLSLAAFLRIATDPRAARAPLSPAAAWAHVADWLDCDLCWIPDPTERHATVLGSLVQRHDLRASRIGDSRLSTVAIGHGLTVHSADADFARFDEIAWVDPLSGS